MIMKCEVCGNLINDHEKECAVCGNPVIHQSGEEEVKKEKWFNLPNQLLLVGSISLFILFFMLVLNLDTYSNFASIQTSFGGQAIPGAAGRKAFGIVGLIFGIPIFIGAVGLMVFQVLYLVKGSINRFEKMSRLFPFIGFIIHAAIAFLSFILMIWAAALFSSAEYFFNQFFIIYGMQAIHIWLFLLAEKPKQIFPKKPVQPSDVEEAPHEANQLTNQEG